MNPTQDWNVITFKKNKNSGQLNSDNITTIKKSKSHINRNSNNNAQNLRKLDEDEIPQIKSVSRSLGKQICEARTMKSLKQVELDNKCNLPRGTTQSYESGKAIYNHNIINKMSKCLGVPLSNKK